MQVFELIGTDRLLRDMDEMQMLVKYIWHNFHVNGSVSANDRLEAELQSELENGRLVRLLCKFGFINERPEYGAFQLLVKGTDLFLGSIEILGGQKRVTDT